MNSSTRSEWVYGLHTVTTALMAGDIPIKKIYLQSNRHDDKVESINQLAVQRGIPVISLSKHELDQLTAVKHHQGIAAESGKPVKWQESHLESFLQIKDVFILVLDGVQDPHNLGACLRTANAAGVDVVIAPKDRAVALTPAVRKVACGAAEITPFIQVTNLARVLNSFKEHGIWLAGATDVASKTVFQADLRGSIALIMGAEGKGLRQLTEKLCDFLILIPMQGQIESLNVSVATGICLYEALRQRMDL